VVRVPSRPPPLAMFPSHPPAQGGTPAAPELARPLSPQDKEVVLPARLVAPSRNFNGGGAWPAHGQMAPTLPPLQDAGGSVELSAYVGASPKTHAANNRDDRDNAQVGIDFPGIAPLPSVELAAEQAAPAARSRYGSRLWSLGLYGLGMPLPSVRSSQLLVCMFLLRAPASSFSL
jgi:hypothetical protein